MLERLSLDENENVVDSKGNIVNGRYVGVPFSIAIDLSAEGKERKKLEERKPSDFIDSYVLQISPSPLSNPNCLVMRVQYFEKFRKGDFVPPKK
jgi:hypothetical protein